MNSVETYFGVTGLLQRSERLTPVSNWMLHNQKEFRRHFCTQDLVLMAPEDFMYLPNCNDGGLCTLKQLGLGRPLI